MDNMRARAIRKRLAEALACLERLDEERLIRGDPRFGKEFEARIIWRELLELELEDIDDQVKRICADWAIPPASQRDHVDG